MIIIIGKQGSCWLGQRGFLCQDGSFWEKWWLVTLARDLIVVDEKSKEAGRGCGAVTHNTDVKGSHSSYKIKTIIWFIVITRILKELVEIYLESRFFSWSIRTAKQLKQLLHSALLTGNTWSYSIKVSGAEIGTAVSIVAFFCIYWGNDQTGPRSAAILKINHVWMG